VATSNAVATPGKGPENTGQSRICVSQIADSANSNFEFVQILVE